MDRACGQATLDRKAGLGEAKNRVEESCSQLGRERPSGAENAAGAKGKERGWGPGAAWGTATEVGKP